MKLIIEIPEEVYEKQRYLQYFGAWSVVLQKCFENGTPLTELDDCVSREAVIELVKKGEYDITGKTDNEMFCDEVNKLPSVQPKREWAKLPDAPKRDTI